MGYLFTADNHFWHYNIIKLCCRPFISLMEMHEVMINNWNEKVGKKDTVIIAGDFSFRNPTHILDRLNGHKILLMGDHDKASLKCKEKFDSIEKAGAMHIRIKNTPVYINHWKNETWYKFYYDSWHLFAHSHGRKDKKEKSWDIGVDNNNFYPLTEDEIIDIMNKKPKNFRKSVEVFDYAI